MVRLIWGLLSSRFISLWLPGIRVCTFSRRERREAGRVDQPLPVCASSSSRRTPSWSSSNTCNRAARHLLLNSVVQAGEPGCWIVPFSQAGGACRSAGLVGLTGQPGLWGVPANHADWRSVSLLAGRRRHGSLVMVRLARLVVASLKYYNDIKQCQQSMYYRNGKNLGNNFFLLEMLKTKDDSLG